jgi:energy-coupling factor transport system substrate-specific component
LYIGWAIGNLVQNANNLERWQNAATTDPLTGLLNKRGADAKLTKACAEDRGFLMIMDLDSFKPVNDIYGHDMGDKILISMAQLMKTCTREEDILCRLGGDEFVTFLRNAEREMVVDDKTKFLNNEILKAARTYLGKDMEIPIGVSIGAVRVPEEGTDYHELLSKADKALYEVKDRGKHAYSIYSSVEGAVASVVDQNMTGGITGLKKILSERGPANGAYPLDYNSLEDVYRIIKRLTMGKCVEPIMIHFEIMADEAADKDLAERLAGIVRASLTGTDIACIDGANRVLAIVLSGKDDKAMDDFAKEIMDKWEKEEDVAKYGIRYDIGKP